MPDPDPDPSRAVTSATSQSPSPQIPSRDFPSAPVLRPEPIPYPIPKPPPLQSPSTPTTTKPPQKKPRSWAAAALRRRFTTLSTTPAPETPVPRPRISSQAEFRRAFLKVHRDRVLRDTAGNTFRLLPVVMNGDCGFAAIAKGINVARDRIRAFSIEAPAACPTSAHEHRKRRWRWTLRRDPGMRDSRLRRSSTCPPQKSVRSLQAKDVRKAMLDELRRARKTYLAECEELAGLFSREDFDKLERDVSQPGIAGHWLGTVLGVLEHVIVSQALQVNIFLYQFDLSRQCIRQFECATVEHPLCEVHLFFTGPASCGHFDTMLKINPDRNVTFVA